MFLYIHRHSSQAMGRSFALLAVFCGSLMASGWSHAQMELAKDKHCLSCHAMDKKVVGPSYLDVAAKYNKDTTAKERLAQKIMKGGSGVWGVIPMPANPQVNPQEAQALAAWVLQLKAP